jgi:hypothetical protein
MFSFAGIKLFDGTMLIDKSFYEADNAHAIQCYWSFCQKSSLKLALNKF